MSECDKLPGDVIYEDEFQVAVKNLYEDISIKTKELGS
jgi:hypothetical protein